MGGTETRLRPDARVAACLQRYRQVEVGVALVSGARRAFGSMGLASFRPTSGTTGFHPRPVAESLANVITSMAILVTCVAVLLVTVGVSGRPGRVPVSYRSELSWRMAWLSLSHWNLVYHVDKTRSLYASGTVCTVFCVDTNQSCSPLTSDLGQAVGMATPRRYGRHSLYSSAYVPFFVLLLSQTLTHTRHMQST